MLCINPLRRPRAEYGCGQCLPCRINRRRIWTGRILLESLAHSESCFLTLTYAENALPEGNSLSDEHWREFTKGIGYRYFGCGEYGETYGRPHYHFVVFGLGAAQGERLAQERWPYGFVCSRPFSSAHAAYVAAYTVKKWTKPGAGLPEGLRPEFARMSRRPAIGTPGIRPFQEWLTTREGAGYLASELDVPQVIKSGGSVYPLGRTLVQKMRDYCDMPSDIPAKHERRAQLHRAIVTHPELGPARERRRHGGYLRQKAIASKRRGVL